LQGTHLRRYRTDLRHDAGARHGAGLVQLVMYIGTGALSGQTLDDSGILNAMATASPLNAQLSCSWAWKPADPSTDDVYFTEFAAQGQNFFAAAGDDGSWAHAEFVWPSDSVYVTSVGGTDWKRPERLVPGLGNRLV